MAAAEAPPDEPIPVLLRSWLPRLFEGRDVRHVSDTLLLVRNHTLYALFVEVALCFISLPLGALRGGISKLSTALNVILLFVATIGLYAAAKLDINFLVAHAALVYGLIGIFCLYLLATIAFGAGNAEDGENWIILVVFLFVVVDAIVACFTGNMARHLYLEKKRLEAAGIAAGAPPPARSALSRALAPGGAAAAARAEPPASEESRRRSRDKDVEAGGASASAARAEEPPEPVPEPGQECVVCLERRKCMVIRPCSHMACCQTCAALLKAQGAQCPICRGPIRETFRVFS
mmetsp:Transcript_15657/g.54374  ORF Transcript_15657/g.54374 Transcript_15657/m.54374 type:complete len:291 (-) Transcript_15657:222-1094(-)|eukprot:CAMPEP_0203817306 /NCGR_PEP_ID=MMETSP0115-20131106/23371_1 /ASSEMBLY_ACC=CAM_ASM_000227 /TAXON_ID=33651 /ORGANISM="Bicosoecid sp, Strain ms1" /LENGTH=290 /DNA_ID=CAMNT_0050726231 /DNA_START=93 /DNA_END=965 /DNA_ORIENTATION=+